VPRARAGNRAAIADFAPGFRQVYVERMFTESEEDLFRLTIGSVYHELVGRRTIHRNMTDIELLFRPEEAKWLGKELSEWAQERRKHGSRSK
jgi:hypothetical protein